jgi:ABC-type branched-subunit amino acid transport system ATPase component
MKEDLVLQIKGVNKSFGGVKAVDNVSFDVIKGEILGIIGPNGSGKTTLVNLITGFVKADSGTVFSEGKKLTGLAPDKIAGLGIVRTFQIPRPYHSHCILRGLCAPLEASWGIEILLP